jgi:hypothetical protein
MKSSKIPIVWERFFKEAEMEHNSALQRYDKKQTEYRTKMRAWEKGTRKSDPPTAPLKPVPRMQAGVRATLSSAQGTETSGGIQRINIGTKIQER